MLQLEPLLQRKPAQLSGGQRQRAADRHALVRQASVFLLDEPLSNLDAQLRGELRRELKLLHKTLGSTMIYVTHDQVEAMTLATRIVVMQGGRIQQVGAPADVYERPDNLFVASFLGAPGMNFLRGHLRSQGPGLIFSAPGLGVDLADYGFRAVPPPDGTAVTLGVRPEHVRLRDGGAWAGTVQLVEPMGNHHVVWIERHGATLSAVVHEGQGAPALRPDQAVRFDIDRRRLSLFATAGGQRL
jgi:multiple sugar transport system ATP-binding protein